MQRNPLLATALALFIIGFGVPFAQAQRPVQLIDFTTTVWSYQTNGSNQGVAWRSRTFDDSAWPSGPGLLGVEAANLYPFPFNTSFPAYDANVITYYFRAHFNMEASDFIWPLTLVMSNLVDDGCVVYLNSNEVHRIRVPAGQNFLTPATGGPALEGAYEPAINISTNGLLVGDNVIAVEVHQPGAGSTDIVNGLSLTAIVPTALTITAQPQSQTNLVRRIVVLSAGISGGPALYQWQTNNGAGTFINVPGATNVSYSNTATVARTTTYRLIASNGVNTVVSSTATVTILPDKTGPLMLSAIVLEEATRTNRIRIEWDENLLTSAVLPPQGLTNFSVVLMPDNILVGISNVQYNPGTFPRPDTPPSTILTMNTTNWLIGSSYCVFVNNVRDGSTNVIAPNSRICVSWPATINVMQMGDEWDFFDSHLLALTFLMTNIYLGPWMATNYTPDYNAWGKGTGPFIKDPTNQIPACVGPLLPSQISIQNEPTLFRRTFLLPTDVPFGTVQFRLRYVLDDGAVFYLNGQELLRVNMPGARGTPVDATTLASNNVANPACVVNDPVLLPPDVPLYPGTNWMAVAVCQGTPLPPNGAEDVAFGLEMDVRPYPPGAVPPNPAPDMTITRLGPDSVRIAWPNGYGYALEATPSLGGGSEMWMEVQPNMANPMVFTNLSSMGGHCFFRLRKAQLQ